MFHNLTKLSMGISDIKDENAIMPFLSCLCLLGVEIKLGVMWHADLNVNCWSTANKCS